MKGFCRYKGCVTVHQLYCEWLARTWMLLSLFVAFSEAQCHFPVMFRRSEFLLRSRTGGGTSSILQFFASTFRIYREGNFDATLDRKCVSTMGVGEDMVYAATDDESFQVIMMDSQQAVVLRSGKRVSDDAADCRNLTKNVRFTTLAPMITLANLLGTDTCPFPDGEYHGTLIDEAGIEQCSGTEESKMMVEGDKLTFNLCADKSTEHEKYDKPRVATFRCGDNLRGVSMDSRRNGHVLLLIAGDTKAKDSRLYCARYFKHLGVIQMMINVIENPHGHGAALCIKGFSPIISTPDTFTVIFSVVKLHGEKLYTRKEKKKSKERASTDTSGDVPFIIGGFAGAILLFLIGVAGAIVWKRKKREKAAATNAAEAAYYDEYGEYDGYNDTENNSAMRSFNTNENAPRLRAHQGRYQNSAVHAQQPLVNQCGAFQTETAHSNCRRPLFAEKRRHVKKRRRQIHYVINMPVNHTTARAMLLPPSSGCHSGEMDTRRRDAVTPGNPARYRSLVTSTRPRVVTSRLNFGDSPRTRIAFEGSAPDCVYNVDGYKR